MDFYIRETQSRADFETVQTLLRLAFNVRPGVGSAFAQVYLDVVTQTTAQSWVAVIQDKIVGHVLLARRTFVMDGAMVSGGVVAMLVVDAAHRRCGIGTALIEAAMNWAQTQGIVMLHLAGDAGFYTRFGFVPAYVRAVVDIAVVPFLDSRPLLLATFEDVDRLVGLSGCERPVGSALVDADRWHWILKTTHPAPLLRCNDQLLGFCAQDDACLVMEHKAFARVCWDRHVLAIYEAAAISIQDARHLLDGLHNFSHQHGCKKMVLHLPPDNRLMQAVVSDGTRMTVEEDAELLVKVLNIPKMMQQMQGVLTQRMYQARWIGVVELRVGDHLFGFANDGQQVTFGQPLAQGWRVVLPERIWVKGVMGVVSMADYLLDKERDLAQVLDVLFPVRQPFFWLADSL